MKNSLYYIVLLCMASVSLWAQSDYKTFLNNKGELDPVYTDNAIRDLYNDKLNKTTASTTYLTKSSASATYANYSTTEELYLRKSSATVTYALYTTGTWTPGEEAKVNLAGTSTLTSGATWSRTENTVNVVFVVTGLTVAVANTFTTLTINQSGLPGLTNTTNIRGFATIAGASYVTAGIVDLSSLNDYIYVAWQGQANEAVSILGWFQYTY